MSARSNLEDFRRCFAHLAREAGKAGLREAAVLAAAGEEAIKDVLLKESGAAKSHGS